MADVTVKGLDEFDAIFGGGMRRVRAGLGVSSFGIQVIELPPNFHMYPDHDHSHDQQPALPQDRYVIPGLQTELYLAPPVGSGIN